MNAVGVDVGGTKIAAARVDVGRGTILAARRRPTAPARGADAVLADCHALVGELRSDDVAAVGLAVCELVDPHGRLRSAETVDWRDFDLLEAFDAVDSDVRAAAVAEARFGAGRDEPDFLYVAVGTGISHCLMVDGRPRLGVRGSAIGTGAPLVERWSGGLALARRTAEEEDVTDKHPITPGELLPARELEGDMLLAAGRYPEARTAYLATLARERGRARSIFGAARAAQLAGDRKTAAEGYREYLRMMEKSDGKRPELAVARGL